MYAGGEPVIARICYGCPRILRQIGQRPLAAEVGIAEGKAAGAFTIGVASGNALGLSLEEMQALPAAERASRIGRAGRALLGAGADLVIDSVADLVPALEQAH